ncbi:hypothetical protein GGF42_006672, partial [Coemansia sp. RSA 2424]
MPPRPKSSARGGRSRKVDRQLPPPPPKVATAASNGKAKKEDNDDGSIESLARKLWLSGSEIKWSETAVSEIMNRHIVGKQYTRSEIQRLERAQYFERYLWPRFTATLDTDDSSDTHILSMVLMINEKHQQGVVDSAWKAMEEEKESGGGGRHFARLFDRVVSLALGILQSGEKPVVGVVDAAVGRLVVVQFLIACFGSLETEHVRNACMPLVSLALWEHIDDTRVLVEAEYERMPQLRKFAKHLKKKKVGAPLLPALIRDFAATLLGRRAGGDPGGGGGGGYHLAYATKFVELLVDLESQLATRRYVNLLLIDHQVLELCEASDWHGQQDDISGTFRGLVALLRERLHFQVSDVSGLALTEAEAKDRHYARMTALQATAFREFPAQLEALALASVASLASEEALARHLAPLDDAALRRLAACVGIRTRSILPPSATLGSLCGDDGLYTRAFTLRAFGERYAAESEKEGDVDSASAYPTEKHVFPAQEQEQVACSIVALGYAVLAAPKLGLQFLTLRDYLARSFALLRLESAHDMRESIADAVRRLQPQAGGGFGGWARMALPVHALAVVDVRPPRLGERAPARVRADLSVDLAGYAESVRAEWDAEARPRAVLILAGVAPGGAVRCVRGCEVERRLDDTSNSPVLRLRVLLDAQQFHADTTASADDVYGALNVVVRRRPQESSLLAVLGAVRALIAAPEPALLPAWLAPTFLGYAAAPTSASAAHAQPSAAPAGRVYFGDTFVSADHVYEVFAGAAFDTPFAKPCVVEFGSGGDGVRVVPHPPLAPYPPSVMVRENAVRFTAAQVAAIGAAAGEGLTLVVGPPGTGKTDVAVQIISNLYHAHPRQTILLLTHSNQALNQLFEKIIAVDIEPRHLLRLGHGEEDLDASERYSKAGRVESFLDRRRELLALVQRLAASLDVPGDFGYTCDTARLFFVAHVRVRWDPYLRRIITPPQPGEVPPVKASDVVADFPFAKFFADEQQHNGPVDRLLLPKEGDDLPTAVRAAESCFRYIESIFDELADIQPFELLRTNTDRSNYLLTNQARIVAMTCTHAAMKRSELIKLGFRYDSVVMEESAQMLDIESFIPLTLQRSSNQLKRLVMIGDHNQLPPVVKHPDLRSFANLEQ